MLALSLWDGELSVPLGNWRQVCVMKTGAIWEREREGKKIRLHFSHGYQALFLFLFLVVIIIIIFLDSLTRSLVLLSAFAPE